MTYHKTLPISAVIVTLNEGALIDECLSSIQFCNEIIVVDLYSEDNSVEIASKYTNKILFHERVPIVEIVRKWVINKVSHDWVFFIDPDEKVTEPLRKDIFNTFQCPLDEFGTIILPWQFFFRKKALKGTRWGGLQKYKPSIIHKNRVEIFEFVHRGQKIKPMYRFLTIKRNENNYLHHNWMMGYKHLIKKHIRYLQHEGVSKYNSGQRYSFKRHLIEHYLSFKNCFYQNKGYLDGLNGLFLSFFWVWYTSMSWIKLYQYQRKLNH